MRILGETPPKTSYEWPRRWRQHYRCRLHGLWEKYLDEVVTRRASPGKPEGEGSIPLFPRKRRAPSGPPPDKEKTCFEVCKAITVPELRALEIRAVQAKPKGLWKAAAIATISSVATQDVVVKQWCGEKNSTARDKITFRFFTMDLTPQIVAEIQRAFLRLGGDLKDFPEVAVPGAFYQVFRDLKADRYLLGTIGSWGDTQTDEETLYSLKRLNSGSPFFDQIIASAEE